MADRDYYDILGVPRGADDAAIRKAYRAKARVMHPDVNPDDPKAEDRFKEVTEAYQILSDPKMRARYDRFGHAGVGRGARGVPGGMGGAGWPGGGAGGGNVPDLEEILGEGLGDIFETLFGGAAGHGNTRRAPQPRTQTARRPTRHEQPVQVSLLESIRGAKRTVRGGGRSLEVTIPAGVGEGSRVRVRGAAPGGADLYLVVKLEADARFRVSGSDLRVDARVDVLDAVLGGEVSVDTPEGPVSLSVPAGTANGRVFRLAGRGLPDAKKAGARGDILARVQVQLPETLDPEERALFERLRALRSTAPTTPTP